MVNFKKTLRFMEETKKIVKDKIVLVKFIKLLKQIGQPFTVKCVKNKNMLLTRTVKLSINQSVMANTKSAIKRIRRISKQTVVNKARKSRYKNALKRMNVLIESKKKADALKFLPKLNSELMKIAKSGIIKKQNASRNISRITKKIASL